MPPKRAVYMTKDRGKSFPTALPVRSGRAYCDALSRKEAGLTVETPLTPLEFLRRARKLHAGREAVVDGDKRFSYAELGARCDRWSAALQALGVRQGDRVATIALNTHEHLEQYYAVPQIGAIVVPLNYRLTAEDFVYLITHSGAKVVCVHPDFID